MKKINLSRLLLVVVSLITMFLMIWISELNKTINFLTSIYMQQHEQQQPARTETRMPGMEKI